MSEIRINDYMKSKLDRCQDAADLDLWNEAVDDAVYATETGVECDDDYKLFHYIDVFVGDVAEEIFGDKLDEQEERDLKKYLFGLRDEVDYSNLAAFYVGVLKWLKDRKKVSKAYPNRGDVGARYVKMNNLAAWATLAYQVQLQIAHGKRAEEVINAVSASLHPSERLDFKAWCRFRFGKNNALYDLNEKIMEQSEGSMNIQNAHSKFAYVHEEGGRYYLPDYNSPFQEAPGKQEPVETPEDLIEKQQKKERFEEARSKLVSRTFAIDKLLEKFFTIISDEDCSEIEDAVNSLRKKIRQLKSATIIRDTVIKTANMMEAKGFSSGHRYLIASAAEFIGDRPTIQKVADSFNINDVSDMLQKLQELSNQLKRRDIVRDIARIDFKLHEMNASALFPELSEAQAKLIDATSYAANKLEDVIPKLRGIAKNPGAAGAPGMAPVAPPLAKTDPVSPSPVAPAPRAAPAPAPTQPSPAEPEKSEGLSALEKAI